MRPINKPLPESWRIYSANDTINFEHVKNGLIDTMGNYCSYCEMPLGGQEIEHHKHYKGWQNQVIKNHWENMLLICADCRSHIVLDTLTVEKRKKLLWPDEHKTFAVHQASPLIYEKTEIDYIVMAGDNIESTEKIPFVFIRANPKAGNELFQKAQNTIEHFQLNMNKSYFKEGENKIFIPKSHHMQRLDSRVFERTKAWEEAENAIDRLHQMMNHPDINKFPFALDMLKKQVASTAFFKGNWSIWMTVFWKEFKDRDLLTELFMKDKRYFPGTATENLFPND